MCAVNKVSLCLSKWRNSWEVFFHPNLITEVLLHSLHRLVSALMYYYVETENLNLRDNAIIYVR